MEDVVERMRANIQVQIVKGDAFRVSYVADTPVIAQKVTERLSSLFIEENLRDREVLAEATNEFLETQLADARRRLVEQEKQLEQYRVQHAGQLPSQLQSNLQGVQNLQMQVQGLVDSTNRDRDRRLVLERMVIELDSRPREASPPPNAADASDGRSPAEQLEALRQSLAAMEVRLRAQHPDVIRTKRLIRELEEGIAAKANGPAAPAQRAVQRPPARRRQRRRSNRSEPRFRHSICRLPTKSSGAGRSSSRSPVTTLASRRVPARESELASLTRDYETLQKVYTDLLSKREQSKVAANLERRQIGEQFSVLDPARLPEKPFSPNRPLFLLIGLVAGLALGGGLAGWLEYRDTSLRSDADVSATLALPVLARVPVRPSIDQSGRQLRDIARSLTASAARMVALLAWTPPGIPAGDAHVSDAPPVARFDRQPAGATRTSKAPREAQPRDTPMSMPAAASSLRLTRATPTAVWPPSSIRSVSHDRSRR